MTKRESDWNTYNELRRYHKMIDDTVIENSNVRIMLFLTENGQDIFKVTMKDGDIIQLRCLSENYHNITI